MFYLLLVLFCPFSDLTLLAGVIGRASSLLRSPVPTVFTFRGPIYPGVTPGVRWLKKKQIILCSCVMKL